MSFFGKCLSKGFIFIIFIFLILTITNSISNQNKEEDKTILTTTKKEKQILKQTWNNFSDYKMTEQKRKKRELFSLSTILILVFWNMILGPFTQMQITSKVGLIGSFSERVCKKSNFIYFKFCIIILFNESNHFEEKII